MGIKDELESEAKKFAEKAGDYLKQKEEELLADARTRLDDEVADLERKAGDKVSEVIRRGTDQLSEKAAGAIDPTKRK